MKNLFISVFIVITSAMAFASDEFKVIFTCEPVIARPDLGMRLQVLQGGLSGLTFIRATRYFIGSSQVNNYVVTRKTIHPRVSGAPIVFTGEGIALNIYIVRPTPRGNLTNLDTRQYGHEQLVCK